MPFYATFLLNNAPSWRKCYFSCSDFAPFSTHNYQFLGTLIGPNRSFYNRNAVFPAGLNSNRVVPGVSIISMGYLLTVRE